MPASSPVVSDVTFPELLERFRGTLQLRNRTPVSSSDAVKVALPLWRTTHYGIAVLMEAWSRSTGIPTAFYVDSFWSLASSIFHKDLSAAIAGFETRARYWVVGAADPGSGKSPAMEPMRDALLAAMAQNRSLAPGGIADGFHTQAAGTHAAAVDRLRRTQGYEMIAAAEGGPLLCPSWASSAAWNQTTHINLQRYLDAAYGGAVPWETAIERKSKQKEGAATTGDAVETGPDRRANVTVLLFQQQSAFAGWWAAAEEKCNIGLGAHFRFSFGSSGVPGRRRLQGFGTDVALPVCGRFFFWQHLANGWPQAHCSPRRCACSLEAQRQYCKVRTHGQGCAP